MKTVDALMKECKKQEKKTFNIDSDLELKV